MEWSVIVFCYNEGSSIRRVVTEIKDTLEKIATSYEIIIVNDGSTDNTEHNCAVLSGSYPFIKLVNHPRNLGIGSALRTGYTHATKNYVCAIPGDGQFNINLLKQIPAFDANTFYSFYRKKTNYNWYRALLTWGNKVFNRLVLGINLKDVNWVKVYTHSQLSLASVQLTSSLIETEICSKLIYLGIQPVEIPSDYLSRTGGTPKGGSMKTLIQALGETIKLIMVVTQFKKAKR